MMQKISEVRDKTVALGIIVVGPEQSHELAIPVKCTGVSCMRGPSVGGLLYHDHFFRRLVGSMNCGETPTESLRRIRRWNHNCEIGHRIEHPVTPGDSFAQIAI